MTTRIIHGDCEIELKTLQDNSIDCIITDPPYFIDKMGDQWDAKQIETDKSNSHIKHIPKGMKFSKNQVKELYEYYLKISKILFQKLKPGGFFLTFSSPRLYHAVAMACELAGFEIRDQLVWIYTQTMPKGMSINHLIDKLNIPETEKQKLIQEYSGFKTPQMRSCHEPICVAMKPTQGTFLQNELNFKTGLINFGATVGINQDKTPANVLTTELISETYNTHFLVAKPSKKEKNENNHPTVKPVELIKQLVKIFCKENALVVDPFAGSGTTLLACKELGRNCIGIEREPEYIEIIKKRLSNKTK